VRQGVLAARVFYGILHLLFYVACIMYKNELKEAVLNWNDHIVFLTIYFGSSIAAVYFFLRAGVNPGYLDATLSIKSTAVEISIEKSDDLEEPTGGVTSTTPPSASYQLGTSTDPEEAPPKSIEYIPPFDAPPQRFCDKC